MSKDYYVYVMGNMRPTLYIGVTNNLIRRVGEHKKSNIRGFTKKYRLVKLLYYETFRDINAALHREKQLKHWKRQWKLDLIESVNPKLEDLYSKIV